MKINILIIVILTCAILVTSCNQSINTAVKEEVVTNFLNEFFSFNKDNRYKTISDTSNDISSLEKSISNYYNAFDDFASQQCIETMTANRLPIKYDLMVYEKNLSLIICDVIIHEVRENVFSFEIIFDSQYDNEFKNIPRCGEVKIAIIENQVLIDAITLIDN